MRLLLSAEVVADTTATAASSRIDSIKTIFNPATCLSRGFCHVAKTGSTSHELYYELHGDRTASTEKGTTTTKVLLIMGLNNSCFAWNKQVEYLAALPGYQVLVFDNRGVGHSAAPKGFYTTSALAQDTIGLLNHVGWKEEIHVVGISLGGMIAQELALAIPERICSLNLTSTRAGNLRTPLTNAAIRMFSRLLFVTSPEQAIPLIVTTLFPKAYLDELDQQNHGQPRRTGIEAEFLMRVRLGKRQTFAGKMGQLAAVLSHKVLPDRLQTLSSIIPKIALITGDEDELISPLASQEIYDALSFASPTDTSGKGNGEGKGNESELVIVKGSGHALPSQNREQYNTFVVRVIEEGKEIALKRVGKVVE